MSEPNQQTVILQAKPAPGPTIDLGMVGEGAGALIAICTAIALIYKLVTRDLRRDIEELGKTIAKEVAAVKLAAEAKSDAIEHRVRNIVSRVDALEHLRTGDIERIVRVETISANVEKSLERIDRNIDDRFDQLAASIREIRVVVPR